MKQAFLVVALSCVVIATGFAQEEDQEFTMAVQANPLGFLFGSYAGNFQYQVAPHHGVMGEIGFASRSSEVGDSEASDSRFNVGAHYRYHFNPTMDSWFLGPFVKFVSLNGESSATDTSTQETISSSYSANTLVFGGNIGRRWISTQGLSIVLRAGYGATSVNLDIEGDADVFSDDEIEVLERALGLVLGFDFELSIGWAF